MVNANGSTYYTLEPYGTAVNTTAAILQDVVTFTYVEETTTDTVANTTGVVDNYVVSTPPLPAAAATSYLTQSDIAPPPNGTFGTDELNNLYVDPVTPSIVVPAATPFVATATTDVVYYTGYEVEYLTPTMGADGFMSCVTATSTYLLDQTYAFEYDDVNSTLGSQLTATGTLDPGFLDVIPQSTCSPGVFVAPAPVMLVIIEITYFRGFAVFLVHHEVSTTGDLVAQTSDSGSSSAPTASSGSGGGGGTADSGGGSSGSGSSGSGSDSGSSGSGNSNSGSGSGSSGSSGNGGSGVSVGPGVVNVGGQQTTVLATFSNGEQSATVTVNGQTVVATATNNNLGDRVASAILGAIGDQGGSSSGGSSGSSGSGSSGSGTVDGVGFGPVQQQGSGGSSSNSGSGSSSGTSSGGTPALADTEGTSGGSSSSGSSGGASDSQSVTIGNGNVQVTPGSNGAVNVGGTTIQPGQSATINGVSVSVPASGGSIVVDGPGGQTTVPVQQPGSTPSPPVVSVGGQAFTANAATQYYLAPGQTLTPGGTATYNGQTVSLAPNADYVVVNGQTQGLGGSAPATTPPPINVAGTVYQANAQGAYVIQGQTLTPGGEVLVNGNLVSLGQGYSSLVVNGVTITAPAVLANPTYEPAITIAGSTFNANQGGESFIISGQTLTPGGVITAFGTTISLGSGSNPSIAVVNGQTETLASIVTAPVIDIGGTTYTESNGASFVIAGQTVRPGQTITVSGTTIAIAGNGQFITINGVTSSLAGSTIPVIDIGGTSFAATSGPNDAYVIGGQTLYPGGPALTYMGSTISLLPGGTAIVVNGKTTYLGNGIYTNPPVITFDGTVFTANSGTTFVIDGMTLTPGGIITVSGTVISLSPYATDVVIGGKTTTLFPATTTPASVSATATPTGPTSSGAIRPSTTKKGAASPNSRPSILLSLSAGLTGVLVAIIGWL